MRPLDESELDRLLALATVAPPSGGWEERMTRQISAMRQKKPFGAAVYEVIAGLLPARHWQFSLAGAALAVLLSVGYYVGWVVPEDEIATLYAAQEWDEIDVM